MLSLYDVTLLPLNQAEVRVTAERWRIASQKLGGGQRVSLVEFVY